MKTVTLKKTSRFRAHSSLALFGTLFLSLSLLSLSSCDMKWLEHDLQVEAKVDGTVVFTGTINTFNDTLLPAMDPAAIPLNYAFAGWALPGWTFEENAFSDLYKAKGLVRYLDVQAYAVNGVVTFTSVVLPKEDMPKAYFTIGWYDKEATSGLNSKIIANFTPVFYDFLSSKGATSKDLENTVIRGYQGNVGTIGAAITSDGDVDVLIGVGKNITSTGGVKTLERVDSLPMGAGFLRSIARLTDTDLAVQVFAWLQTSEALDALK